jgi:hypothetical protein
MIALLKTRLPAILTWDVHDWLVSWLATESRWSATHS